MANKHVKYCVVDAFTDSPFKGNPAAVCLLEEKRDDDWLQAVASEFNISETCFLTRVVDPGSATPTFHLRWFTPVIEVELCGHATLAAAHVLFSHGLVDADEVHFLTLSGILPAKRVLEAKFSGSSNIQNGTTQQVYFIELDFPAAQISEHNGIEASAISKSLSGASVIEIHRTSIDDLLAVLPSGEAVVEAQPQFNEIRKFPGRGLIITGPAPVGSHFDFYSRFFPPNSGIDEDPVCGSAHCALASYWSRRLGKCDFVTYQASPRSGVINMHLDEKSQRVFLRGKAVTVIEGYLIV